MFTIPNLITLLNLLFGCLAAISIINESYHLAIIFSLAGGLADFLDGMVARLLNVQSNIGKELDSLADMVSLIRSGHNFLQIDCLNLPWPGLSVINWYAVPAFLITMFSALRLAKFNLDNRQTESFIGMPTPQQQFGLWVGCGCWLKEKMIFIPGFFSPIILLISILLISYLLVSEIPMFSLKFKDFSWKENSVRFLFFGVALNRIFWFCRHSDHSWLFHCILFFLYLEILPVMMKARFKRGSCHPDFYHF
ncbi:MAG: CDP-alcohol phosphatidyltransferase family protein [Saprospiraceae bacterium]